MAHFRYPRLTRKTGERAIILAGEVLRKKLAEVDTVEQLQQKIEPLLLHAIRTTTSDLSFSGIEKLPCSKNYLFISNHRDIVMDPALVNLSAYHHRIQTPRLAIGDNLLTYPFVSDMMRLNKSFIVKRSLTSPRQKFTALKTLSSYIRHSLKEEHQSVWIAQREGRAKDGNDRTEATIIKMIHMSAKAEGLTFAESMASLNIVPVSIAYEYDPCDAMKARELLAKEQKGHYEKGKNEDMLSIVKGIQEYKGHIHVAFGTPLTGSFRNAQEVASAIDKQIHKMYRLYPCNILAWQQLHPDHHADLFSIKSEFTQTEWDKKHDEFQQRLATMPAELHSTLLNMYAQPARNYLAI